MFSGGAKWLRLDCHLHTMGGNEGLSNMSYEGEEQRFNNDFIEKLKKEKIDIGFITNHNEFFLEQYKELNRLAKREDIYLCPGVELNIKEGSNGLHTLIIFDEEDWIDNKRNKNYIEEFLIESFSGQESRKERTNKDLMGVIKDLNKYEKDYFIIFAHINQSSGFMKEISNGLMSFLGKQNQFKNNVLGFQKMRSSKHKDKLIVNNVERLEENLKYRKAYIEGSDPKSIKEIGTGDKTFIKIGEYNFKSLKYALINHKRRILTPRAERERYRLTEGDIETKINNKKQREGTKDKTKEELRKLIKENNQIKINNIKDSPGTDRVYIKSIEYLGGKLDGKTIKLSPELNSIIGIRGSGKSGLIETIRYCLGIELNEDENSGKEYKNELIEYILGTGGQIICNVVEEEKEYRIIRNYGGDIKIEEKIASDNYKVKEFGRKAIIKNPLYFGQKDLTTNKDGYERILLEKLIGEKLDDIENSIENIKKDIINKVEKYFKIKKYDEEKKEIEENNKNLKHEQDKYKEYKLEERLEKEKNIKLDSQELSRLNKKLDKKFKVLKEELDLLSELANENNLKTKENKKALDDIYIKIVKNIEVIKENMVNLNNNIKEVSELKEKVDKEIVKRNEEFSEIKREIAKELSRENITDVNAETIIDIEKEITRNENKIKELDGKIEKKEEILKEIERKIEKKEEMIEERRNIYKDSIEKINKNKELKVVLDSEGDIEKFEEDLIEGFRGSNLRKDSVLIPISMNYRNIYEMFLDIFKNESRKLKDIIENEKNRVDLSDFLEKNYKNILNIEKKEKVKINYHGKNINKHSIGQKASAIILFILTQDDNDLIIIDQPEDDLDNKVIYDELIESILNKKSSTQFIFATHNANIPVLGDTEQILVMNYDDISGDSLIECKSGSIDKYKRQKDIIEIMEGGSKAFEKRNNIYSMWL